MKPTSLDELISKKAEEFADQVRAAAAMADKEEEIRIEVEKQLAFVQKEAGVKLQGKHEFTVASGRVDSVYDRVIIEYKNPASAGARIGPSPNSPGAKKVVEQIKSRFYDLRSKETLNTLFGVGCDGNHFIFVRYYLDKWHVEEPVEVNKYSAERFISVLFSFGRGAKRFEPEYLAGDFGSAEGSVAREGIKVLYDAICSTTNAKAQTFFNQWKILFGEVCGYDVDNPSEKIKKLATFYGVPSRGVKPAEMLFAVHTYYALFMKLLAGEIIGHFHDLPSLIQRVRNAPSSNKLRDVLEDLEQGGIFRHLNITNFLEGDLFAWYLPAWSEPIDDLVRKLASRLADYNPMTLKEKPAEARDLLKKLYQQLFPKSVRHDLGEYYTPDWLAEHVLNELGYVGDPDKRLLDPACGSGTFLVMAITRIRAWYEKNREKLRYDEGELCKKILANVVGFDLNPLAVMAARTNYLIAIRDLVRHVDKVEIPVYLCDSILTPSTYGGLFAGSPDAAKELKTSAARFFVPTEIAKKREDVAKYAEQLEFCVRNGYAPMEFIQRCKDEGLAVTAQVLHMDLYKELVKLDKANKNGVWARIIKNAFAPLFSGTFAYVAGNPPWVRWGYLPRDYREDTVKLWQQYGLFSLKGFEARLGSGEKDLSQLFVYACIDNYLCSGGLLGFLITKTVFKAKGQAEGFRRFKLGESGDAFRIRTVDDLSALQPFEGAANLTAAFVCEKGEPTEYPVPYTVWEPTKRAAISPEDSLERVLQSVTRSKFEARPLSEQSNSQWQTSRQGLGDTIRKVMGKCTYKASVGARIEPYGVYLVRALGPPKGDTILVENLATSGKRQIDQVNAQIETKFLYPIARGKDIERWFARTSSLVLMVQDPETRRGYSAAWMKRVFPLTFQYLNQFRDVLENRAAFKKYHAESGAAFYSMFNISADTFAPFKVAWRRMGNEMRTTVLSTMSVEYLGDRMIIPSDTVTLVPFDDEEEAHYLASLMNSIPARAAVYSFSAGGRGLGTPAILRSLGISRFDRKSKLHKQLSATARKLAKMQERTNPSLGAFDAIERENDELAAEYWNLTAQELSDLRVIVEDQEGRDGAGSSAADDMQSAMFRIATSDEE